MRDVARRGAVWHGAAMTSRNRLSGGIFLTIFILGGLAWGIFARDPMKGVVIGTALGIVAAVLVWVADSRRR